MVNDYDKFAKERQEKLKSGMLPAHRFVEKPMMKSMMPDLTLKKILMLGCGTGEETELLQLFGADINNLIGIDLSEESIKIAKETYPNIDFRVSDMNELPFMDESFDFVYSSLTIHYTKTPNKVYDEVYRVLKKDGLLLFSVGHPIRWGSMEKEINGKIYRLMGCSINDNESIVYGKYNTFEKHTFSSFAWQNREDNEILSFYVGSPSFHFKLLRKSGFEVLDFTESKCIEEAKEVDINYYSKNKELPQFMSFLAKK